MKFIFQLIGFLVVVILLFTAVLFYLDSKAMLNGELGELIHTLRGIWAQARTLLGSFMNTSGISDDAADLLDDGADLLRKSAAPDAPAATPAASPAPSAGSAIIEIIPPSP